MSGTTKVGLLSRDCGVEVDLMSVTTEGMYGSGTRVYRLIGLVVLLLAGGMFLQGGVGRQPTGAEILTFADCGAAGYPVMESFPRQCRTPDGRMFTEDIGHEVGKPNLIRVSSPRPNQEVASPLIVEGAARGNWYFEATFPVTLLDADGNVIAHHYAEAQAEWMTTEFVPFRTELKFNQPGTNRGTLVLHKHNASGLPEHDDVLEVPVRFKGAITPPTETGRKRGGCLITGCSGQVCADHDVITTCEYRPEFACYENAVCERQADGPCGWTLTAALGRCLQELSSIS